MVGGSCQDNCPNGCANTVQQQIAARRVAREADGYRHDGAQAVNKAEAQDPDVRVLADVLQSLVAHELPARFARQQFAAVLAPQKVPKLIAGITAEERHDHDQFEVHVSAKRQEACENQNGLTFKERP